MLKVAIIGLGTVSSVHRLAIEDSQVAELVAVCDINDDKFHEYPDVRTYTSVSGMLENEDLDVVHVCLPHNLHVPIAKECIEAGLHVYLEKPMAISYEEGKEFCDFLEGRSEKVAVSFQNRYNASSIELMRIIEEDKEKLGQMLAVKGLVVWFRPISYYESEPWRGTWIEAGGGTITNQSIHTLDLIQWFASGELETTQGRLASLLDYDIEVEDTAVAAFEFDNDVQGFYFATNAYKDNSSVEVEVLFEHGRLVIKDYALFAQFEGDEHLQHIVTDEISTGTKHYYGQGHKICIDKFYDSIINDREDYVSAKEALVSLLMIDSLKKSSQEERVVDAKEIKNE